MLLLLLLSGSCCRCGSLSSCRLLHGQLFAGSLLLLGLLSCLLLLRIRRGCVVVVRRGYGCAQSRPLCLRLLRCLVMLLLRHLPRWVAGVKAASLPWLQLMLDEGVSGRVILQQMRRLRRSGSAARVDLMRVRRVLLLLLLRHLRCCGSGQGVIARSASRQLLKLLLHLVLSVVVVVLCSVGARPLLVVGALLLLLLHVVLLLSQRRAEHAGALGWSAAAWHHGQLLAVLGVRLRQCVKCRATLLLHCRHAGEVLAGRQLLCGFQFG